MRFLKRTLAILAAGLAAPALAEDPAALARVDIGWGTTVTAGRWTPMRVWLDGSVGALAGMITVEYEQDRTQMARVLVPASTTPGALTPVELAVCIPADVGAVSVTFSSAGRRDESMKFAPPPTAGAVATPKPGQLQLGQLYGGTRGLIACLGVGSIERAFPKPIAVDESPAVQGRIIEGFLSAEGETLTELRWMQLAAAAVEPDGLPTIPQSYSGLEALVLDAGRASNLPPRTRRAIMDWVGSGGRLLVLSTDDSNAWRAWLPEGEAGELLTRGDPTRLAPPPSVLEGLGSQTFDFFPKVPNTESRPSHVPPGLRGGVGELHVSTNAAPALQLRKDALARPVSTTAAGKAAGWTVGWTISEGTGLYACGPVGLGMVTVLGVDPEALPQGLDPEASRRLWRRALEASVKNYLTAPFAHGEPGQGEVTTALNTILGVPPLRNTVFNVVLVSLGVLGLLMGPVDWFVLKRFRVRQHSWLVALGWISLASIAAYVIPPMLRSGPPQVNRLLATDVLQETNSLTSRSAEWSDGLTGVFASGPLEIAFDPDPASPTNGSWWHGVAAERVDYRRIIRSNNERRELRTISPIETPQLTSRRGERQNVPIPIRMPSWSYRTMSDSSTGRADAPRARVSRGADGTYRVEIAGLPEQAPVGRLSLFDASGRVDDGRVSFSRAGGAPLTPTEGCVPERAESGMTFDGYGNWRTVKPRDSMFHWTTMIPGVERREAAVRARLAGGWAVVEVVLGAPGPWARFMPQAVLDREGFVVSGVSTIRILVPLNAGADSPKEPTP